MVLAALTDAEHGVIRDMSEISAVGHRVVHGGEFFSKSVIIDDNVKKAIDQCVPLAPLHNPPNLIGIDACEKAMPGCGIRYGISSDHAAGGLYVRFALPLL